MIPLIPLKSFKWNCLILTSPKRMKSSRGQFPESADSGNEFTHIPVEYTMIEGEAIFEGDIILQLDDPAQLGTGVRGRQYRWDDGVIPYVIDDNLPMQYRVHDAIAHWEENTPIRFVERTNERNYVVFRPGNGCSSYVGMRGGGQPIILAPACFYRQYHS